MKRKEFLAGLLALGVAPLAPGRRKGIGDAEFSNKYYKDKEYGGGLGDLLRDYIKGDNSRKVDDKIIEMLNGLTFHHE